MPGSCRGRYHTDGQPSVDGLVYAFLIVVAANEVPMPGLPTGQVPASQGGGTARVFQTRPYRAFPVTRCGPLSPAYAAAGTTPTGT